MTRAEKYYLVLGSEKICLEEDGTISITVEAYKEGEEKDEPIKLVLNLGDEEDDIIDFLKRVTVKTALLRVKRIEKQIDKMLAHGCEILGS